LSPARPSPDLFRDGGVVVVGGGLAGLSAAIELAPHQVPVTIVEANPTLGGMLGTIEVDGYSFDTGPTTITQPKVLTSIFERAGRDPANHLNLVRLNPQWRCFFEDGAQLDLPGDPEQLPRAMGPGGESFHQFARHALRSGEPSRRPSLKNARTTIEKFIRNPHARRTCEHLLHTAGSDPSRAPAALCRLAAAQLDEGLWYAKGGTHTIARALERLAGELGIQSVTGRRVTKILVQDDHATAVKLDDGREITAGAVISCCDIRRTYGELLKGVGGAALELRRITSKHEPSCSATVLHLGLRKQYDHLAHDNVLFSHDGPQEIEDIFEKRIPARDPTLHVTAPSCTDATRAPKGCEALTVLAYTPAQADRHEWLLRGGRPGKTLTRYRSIILEKLKRHGMGDIVDHVAVERSLTPAHFEHLYGVPGGSIYGLSSHGRLRGLTKPLSRSKVVSNLYLAGGSVTPGPGVPAVLTSGLLAARSLCEDFGVDL
jgi:phytoene desaturase